LLKNAELLLCDLVDFDPSTVADQVLYVYGRELSPNTFGWFGLNSALPQVIDKFTNVLGDGTVPVYSANNSVKSKTSEVIEVPSATHVQLISSLAVLNIIDDWYAGATKHAELALGRTNVTYTSLLSADIAASGNLVPISLDATSWSDNDEALAIEINKKALGLMGFGSASVAKIADATPDPIERGKLYAVAASLASDHLERLTLITELAKTAYQASHFQEAIKNSALVGTLADAGTLEREPSAKTQVKLAQEILGWSYLREGDLGKFNAISTDYARQYQVQLAEPKSLDFFDLSGRSVTTEAAKNSPDHVRAIFNGPIVKKWEILPPSPQ
jgi:hypothetical protein